MRERRRGIDADTEVRATRGRHGVIDELHPKSLGIPDEFIAQSGVHRRTIVRRRPSDAHRHAPEITGELDDLKQRIARPLDAVRVNKVFRRNPGIDPADRQLMPPKPGDEVTSPGPVEIARTEPGLRRAELDHAHAKRRAAFEGCAPCAGQRGDRRRERRPRAIIICRVQDSHRA